MKKITYSLNYRKPKEEYTQNCELTVCVRYYHKLEMEWNDFLQLPNFESVRRTRCLIKQNSKFSYSNQTQQFKNKKENEMRDYVTSQ